MDTLFDDATFERTLERIDRLRHDAKREWGKMDAAQAMAHCALAMEAATGRRASCGLLRRITTPSRTRISACTSRCFDYVAANDLDLVYEHLYDLGV